MGYFPIRILTIVFVAVVSQLPTPTVSQFDGFTPPSDFNPISIISGFSSGEEPFVCPDCIPGNKGGCPAADGGLVENNGNCFHFSTAATTWTKARRKCQDLGAKYKSFFDLAELGNPQNLGSDYWLMEQIARNVSAHRRWLGAYSPRQNDQWVWAHSGRSLGLDFPLWGPSEPSGDGWCVDASPNGNQGRYYMNDHNCNNNHHYVCQQF